MRAVVWRAVVARLSSGKCRGRRVGLMGHSVERIPIQTLLHGSAALGSYIQEAYLPGTATTPPVVWGVVRPGV